MSEKVHALVVYESMFGSTGRIAEAIAEGLGQTAEVELMRVDRAPDTLAGVDLLVVGGPTHAFSMSRRSTREDASKQGIVVMSTQVGIREWLDRLQTGDSPVIYATFDTRVTKVRRLPGSAAKAAAKVLRRRGFASSAGPESFYVEDVAGPLAEGELERARTWGATLAAGFTHTGQPTDDGTAHRHRAN